MLVYGDAARVESTRDKLEAIAAQLVRARRMPPGLPRHAALVAALIEAGELAQGISDALFRCCGCDRDPPAMQAVNAGLRDVAQAVCASWSSGFLEPLTLPAIDLSGLKLPDTIEVKQPEGFALYALYPELYAAAAASSGLGSDTTVIGIRSIGTSLGAVVASSLGARRFFTVRPAGHPFHRELAVSENLPGRLTGHFAVVDEGPGLSGSSFGAVGDFLEDRGVPRGQISFFPSHTGAPGPHAVERHRRRWSHAARHVQPLDDLLLHAPHHAHRLSAWAADLLGAPEMPLEDISGGAWRRHRYVSQHHWPPVNAQQERRKFLLRANGADWMLKFAGLGRYGEAKLTLARQLHAAGFTPEVAGFCHGFLLERWMAQVRPLDVRNVDPVRTAEQIGRYLGFRAGRFPARQAPGSSPAELLNMARENAEQALGGDSTRYFDRWTANALRGIAERLIYVKTDNRMHAWEWLVLPGGRLLKTDALDHHAAHDLIGAQDIAWDVVGATAELELPESAEARLCATIERQCGRHTDRDVLEFYRPCYLAFQLGYYSMAVDVASDTDEAARLNAAAQRYAQQLRALIL